MKWIRIAAIALCVTLMVLPSSAIPFFRQRENGAEYRNLAPFPQLTDEEEGPNLEFPREFEAWLGDHFAFRTTAVRVNALANYRLLQTSVNEEVIVGRNGWLYYADTVPDFTGEGRLSDAELDQIVENLHLMADSFAARGARLYIAIIPNKSSIYPEFMPDRYSRRQDGGNISRLKAACVGIQATWIDLTEPLEAAARSDARVYYQTDTHWNALGACVAADAILRATGKGGAGDYAIAGESEYSEGDLARLMGLQGDLRERAPVVQSSRALPQADYSERALKVEGTGSGRLLVFRDSFGTAIGPWLVQAYARTELRWENPLEAWRSCDDALVLIAERNLRLYLMGSAELAPEDDGDLDDEDFDDEDFDDEDFDDEDFDDEDFDDEDFDDEDFDDEDFDDEDFDDEDFDDEDFDDEDFDDEDFDDEDLDDEEIAAAGVFARQRMTGAQARRARHGI